MKTRKGFISNSSSSSFIVGFEKLPETKEELQKLLFGKECSLPDLCEDDEYVSTDSLAKEIWDDLQQALKGKTENFWYSEPKRLTTKAEIVEALMSGWVDDIDESNYHRWDSFYYMFKKPDGTTDYQAVHEAREKERKELAERLYDRDIQRHEGKLCFFYLLGSHEDHDPVGSVLDHGDVFRRLLVNIKVSHH